MEASVDPQVTISTDDEAAAATAEVNIQPLADPRLVLLVPKSTAIAVQQNTESSHTVDESQQQSTSKGGPPQIQQPPIQATDETNLDEERIHATIDMSINPSDVLSGRGKQAFNHGTLIVV